MIIGVGHHCRRIYYPIFEKLKNYNLVIVDTSSEKEKIKKYVSKMKLKPLGEIYIEKFSDKKDSLPSEIEEKLNEQIKKYSIKGVIISTDPLYHHQYAKWALKNELSILMDKPITITKNISTNPDLSNKLNEHYIELKNLYKKMNNKKRKTLFSIVSQRRFHNGFKRVKELLQEVYEKTNCPPTSIQMSHSDGQWRLPHEIVDIDYHSYNKGFGKVSHSGYHFIDIINFLTDFVKDDKKADNVDINSKFLRPLDFTSQITIEDYKKIFGEKFSKTNKYDINLLNERMKNFGEIDAFITLAFKKGDRIALLGSVNLIHNSFSLRGNLIPNKDLYKGNGRVRHESYTIEQGPFQCIQIISFQSKEVTKEKRPNYRTGGEYHFDIYVFRNNNLIKKWKRLEKISIKDIQSNEMQGKSRGHQEDARMIATNEFLEFLNGKTKEKYTSDFLDHENNVRLIAGIYKSAALDFNDLNSNVEIKI